MRHRHRHHALIRQAAPYPAPPQLSTISRSPRSSTTAERGPRISTAPPARRICAAAGFGAPPPADPSEMPLPVPFELRGKPKEKKADESDDGKKKKFGTAARSLGF